MLDPFSIISTDAEEATFFSPSPVSTFSPTGVCLNLIRPKSIAFPVPWFDIILGLPSLVFLIVLGINFKDSVRKLVKSKSQIMTMYYGFLWIVCILNTFRCVLEIWQSHSFNSRNDLWNFMYLSMRFALVFLEISVVVFLSQGYLVSGWEALRRTVFISLFFAILDSLFKASVMYKDGSQLFVGIDDLNNFRKWMFWTTHELLFAFVYLLILLLPYTKWRDRLPARPSFYVYVFILFALNIVAAFGSMLVGLKTDIGYCVFGLSSFTYYGLFPPLLYFTFLYDFFKEEGSRLEEFYYSEMKDAGFFDNDWE